MVTDDFRQALHNLANAASSLLGPICAGLRPRRILGLEQWSKMEDGSFVLSDRIDEPWAETFRVARDTIRALPELDAAAQALKAHSPFSALFSGQQLGSALGTTQLSSTGIAITFLWRLAEIARGFSFDAEAIATAIIVIEAELLSNTVLVQVLAPLMGLRCISAPLELQADLTIEEMTENEIATCLRLGAIRPQFGQLARTPPLNGLCAAKLIVRLPRAPGVASLGDANRVWATATDTILDVVQALRLFKDGTLQLPVVIFSSDWPLDGKSHTIHGLEPTIQHHSWTADYVLDEKDAAAFVNLWSAIQGPRAKRLVTTAARRFSYARSRHRADDQIVDLMIAAEALFLGDSGKAQDRGELRYRLALRAAHFIDEPGLTRRQVFDHMKRAYDVRSTIVHGGVADPRSLRSPTGEKISLIEFAKLTFRLLQAAILRGVAESDGKAGSLIDWDARILGSQNLTNEDSDAEEAG